jgi:hypothetical protein
MLDAAHPIYISVHPMWQIPRLLTPVVDTRLCNEFAFFAGRHFFVGAFETILRYARVQIRPFVLR